MTPFPAPRARRLFAAHVGLVMAPLLALTAACGGPTTPDTAADVAAIPDGPVERGLHDTADAGFAKVTVETMPCGEGLVGVGVRVANTGKKAIALHQIEPTGLGAKGDVLRNKVPPYKSPCSEAARPSKIAPGEAATVWLAFDPGVAIAKVEVEEPDGLAKLTARFHLDEDHVDDARSGAAATSRAAPPAGALAKHETPYYRLSIVDVKGCRDGDRNFIAYEVVAESFTNVTIDVYAREVVDARSASHQRPDYTSRCFLVLPHGEPLDELAPRARVRTWTSPFTVPADAGELTLGMAIGGYGLSRDEVSLRPGAPRSWVKAPDPPSFGPSPAQQAAQQAERRAALDRIANPPPAGKPEFRELPPIPKDPLAYHEVKMRHLVREHYVAHDNFLLTAVPITPALYAAGMYRTWSEKRFDDAAMKKLVADFATRLKTELRVQMPVVHHGSVMGNGGEHSLTLPQDLNESIFLEVDGEKAIRCREAIVPLMGTVVGPFSPQTTVELVFDLPPGFDTRIMKGTGELRVVVGGLGFKDKTVRWKLPLSDLTRDAPAEITRIAP